VTKLSRRNDPLPPGQSPPTFIYEGFKDEDALTQGDYEVIVTDARWISHLKVGQTWQTPSYATKAKMPKGRETVLLDEGASEAAPAKRAAKKAAKKVPAKKVAKKVAAKKVAKKVAAKKVAKKVPAKKAAKKAAKR
jgi:topoisomerase IA-like protein